MRAISGTGRRRARGFTLIELMVVIALLVLLSAALPLALNRSLPKRQVVAASERIVVAIREAQLESLRTGRPALVALKGLPASTHVHVVDDEGREQDEVRVYPDGSTSGARFEIQAGSKTATVVVSGLTGRVLRE